jgi:hypothetical protein
MRDDDRTGLRVLYHPNDSTYIGSIQGHIVPANPSFSSRCAAPHQRASFLRMSSPSIPRAAQWRPDHLEAEVANPLALHNSMAVMKSMGWLPVEATIFTLSRLTARRVPPR